MSNRMLKNASIIIFLLFALPMVVLADNFRVFKFEISNLEEKAYVKVPGIEYPVLFEKAGVYSLPISFEEKAEIKCFTTRTFLNATIENKKSHKILFDLKTDPNKKTNTDIDFSIINAIPFDQLKGWLYGQLSDSETKTPLYNASIKLVVPYYFEKIMGQHLVYLSHHKNTSAYILPLFNESDLAFLISAEGYSQQVKTIGVDEFYRPKEKIAELPFINKDILLKKVNDSSQRLILLPYRVGNRRLHFAGNTEVFDQQLHNRYKCSESGILDIMVNPEVTLELNCYHPVYGRVKYFVPLSDSFQFHFVELETTPSINNSRLSDIIKGGATISGIITDETTGDPLPNVMVSLNDGERILYSDFLGYYKFHSIARGKYGITVKKKGYISAYFTLNLNNFHAKLPITLDPITEQKDAVLKGKLDYGTWVTFPQHITGLYIVETGEKCRIDENNNFVFDPMYPGTYTLSVQGEERDVEVTVEADKTKIVILDCSRSYSLGKISEYFEGEKETAAQAEPHRVFANPVGNRPSRDPYRNVKWFLDGNLLVNLKTTDEQPLIPRCPTIDYYSLKDMELKVYNLENFGKIGVRCNTLDNYNLLLIPSESDTLSIPFQITHKNRAPEPFIIFDVYFEKNRNGRITKSHHEIESIQYPPTKEQLKRYPWMEQRYLY